MNKELDEKELAIIAKVKKLLAMANGNANEHEAANAAAKAAQLLEAYNLDMAVLGRAKITKRQDTKKAGGLYKWQRDLWYAVAKLNFCLYSYHRGLTAGSQYEHQIIGSHANVISTEVMAEYLQSTIERLARNWVKANAPGKSVFIKPAIAYREGLATCISNRVWTLRQQRLAEDEENVRQERARNSAMGINTENALVLQDVINTEEDLNNDYLYGYEPGTHAKRRFERDIMRRKTEAEVAELMRKQDEWDAAHPEEAAARKKREAAAYAANSAKWSKQYEKSRNKKPTAEEERRNLPSFYQGYRDGDSVSLDKQVDSKAKLRLN
jgi:hypothetical protein